MAADPQHVETIPTNMEDEDTAREEIKQVSETGDVSEDVPQTDETSQHDGINTETTVEDEAGTADTGTPLENESETIGETSETLAAEDDGGTVEDELQAEEENDVSDTGVTLETDLDNVDETLKTPEEEGANSGVDSEVPVTEIEPESDGHNPDKAVSDQEEEGLDDSAINDETEADNNEGVVSPLLEEETENSQDNLETIEDLQEEATEAADDDIDATMPSTERTDENTDAVSINTEEVEEAVDEGNQPNDVEEELLDNEDIGETSEVDNVAGGQNSVDEPNFDDLSVAPDNSPPDAQIKSMQNMDDDNAEVEMEEKEDEITDNIQEESNFEGVNSDTDCVQDTDDKGVDETEGTLDLPGDSIDADEPNAENEVVDEIDNDSAENMEIPEIDNSETSPIESVKTGDNENSDNVANDIQSEGIDVEDNEKTEEGDDSITAVNQEEGSISPDEVSQDSISNVENIDSSNDNVTPNEDVIDLNDGLQNETEDNNDKVEQFEENLDDSNKTGDNLSVDDDKVTDENSSQDGVNLETEEDTKSMEQSNQNDTTSNEEEMENTEDKVNDESVSAETGKDDTETPPILDSIDTKDAKQSMEVDDEDDILDLTNEEAVKDGEESMDITESSIQPKEDEKKDGKPEESSDSASKESAEAVGIKTKKELPDTFDLAATKEDSASLEADKESSIVQESGAPIEDDVKQEETEENVSEIKIVGVTSAVWKEDDTKVDSGLKIASVSGAEQIKPKTDDVKQDGLKPELVKAEGQAGKTESGADKKVKDETKKVEEDDDVIAIKEEKKPAPKPKASKIQKCIVCAKVGKCKYNIVRNGDVKHLCDDVCFKQFRSNPTTFLKQAETEKAKQNAEVPVKNGTQQAANTPPTAVKPKGGLTSLLPAKTTPGGDVYKTCTVCQLMNVRTSKPFLTWQDLDYCGEECLGKFQGNLSTACSYCSSDIHQSNKAKYCCRIGSEVKHFCSHTCNNEFVKRIKTCAFCNKDLASENDSFMAPVGNQGMFKDFCSQACLLKYEDKNEKENQATGARLQGMKTGTTPSGNYSCAVCGKNGPVKHELVLDKKAHRLCSDPCYSAFQYANKLTLNACDNCGTNCFNDGQAPNFVQFEGKQKRFCSFMCVNAFRNKKKKPTPCAWCGTKKSNFDMIERVDSNNKFQLFCSLNCLSLYRVNLQATSNQAVVCDQCRKFVPAQYHLTMSDASVRNFCSYGCVMQFQSQFQAPTNQKTPNAAQKAIQPQPPTQQQPITTTRSGRVVTRGVKQQAYVEQQMEQQVRKEVTSKTKTNQDGFVPIISNMVSLSPKVGQQQINIKSPANVTVTDQQTGVKKITTSTSGNQTVQQQIIIQPPPPKTVKNKSTLCKPFVQTKATACRPHTQTKEMQTEGKPEPEKIFIPVPVPIYCPTPLSMYSMPAPILIPVPVPIPIPVFIPTTKKSSASILKQIKEIQDKIPADPLEAELLMMAEAVAGKGEESSSDSDNDEPEAPPPTTKDATPAPNSGVLGEDMLQMALRMASEMSDEPVMDLENSLEPVAVNTARPQQPSPALEMEEQPEEEDEYVPTTRSRRGRGSAKRQTRATPRRNAKRQKIETPPQPALEEHSPSPPPVQARPPDANFHLKYTYGVNAFKHWVTQKNLQIETTMKTGNTRPLKTFKTDILQCTADELNHSLCLFVKEVRKPNGEEYAVDSIYYLCLGIQQYLFESGRIDNVFTDMYYERFTECLNELLCRYEPKLNQAGQLVCRIEEEHLWESKQLGAHSPHVLLNTLVYFNTKFFMLKTSEDHLKLSFTHIMKHWKKTASGRGSGTGPNLGRSVYLRYYCPTPQNKENAQKKKKEEMPVYEQTENLDNPLRCPVKLYEFYLSKCPESIKNRNDTFYLVPERSCVPDSPVWYSTAMLGVDSMAKMLNRIRLVREIQEAHLHTQPIYI